MQRTASDELYHAVWATTEGKHRVDLPMDARITELNKSLEPSEVDEHTWLARLRVSREEWDNLCSGQANKATTAPQ